jgi:4-hydroxybenzoate polyprenyltransferase
MVFWIWLHVLQFNVANQIIDPDEDAKNKSDRPLPSKRITLEQASWLRWLLVPACFLLSAYYSKQALKTSVVLALLIIVYNEYSAHRIHWIVRNVLCALGLMLFEIGATLVAGTCLLIYCGADLLADNS